MIRVTVEIVPTGVEEVKRALGVYEIANYAVSENNVGKYNVSKNGKFIGRIRNHKRADGFEKLVLRVFKFICNGG